MNKAKEGHQCGERDEWSPILKKLSALLGFPGGSESKESACSAGDLVPSLGQEDPLRRDCLPTPVFSPGRSHGQRSLAGLAKCVSTIYGQLLCCFIKHGENTHTDSHPYAIFSK